jgi:hypothetical protein
MIYNETTSGGIEADGSGINYVIDSKTVAGGVSVNGAVDEKVVYSVNAQGGTLVASRCSGTTDADPVSATIETIGSTGDYTSPQAWYDAHSGDITDDTNAPYIGEMAAETFGSQLWMGNSTTDADHYFHLRAQSGAEFNGDFAGSYPLLSSDVPQIVVINDDYTVVENIVAGDVDRTGGSLDGFYVSQASNVVLDTVGVYNLSATHTDSIHIHGITIAGVPEIKGKATIRNCAIGKLFGVFDPGKSGTLWGIHVSNDSTTQVYNCAIEGLATDSTVETHSAYGIEVADIRCHTTIANNVIGSLDAPTIRGIYVEGASEDQVVELTNNATIDTSGGTNSQDNIVPADEFVDITPATLDLHMLVGGQCEDNGLNLLAAEYTDAPTRDIDGDARPNPGTWSIGVDHHVVCGDDADIEVTYSLPTDGGVAANGEALDARNFHDIGEGGTEVNGSASDTHHQEVGISGGIKVNGSRYFDHHYYEASGEVVIGGEVETLRLNFHRYYPDGDIVVINGTADDAYGLVYEADGGVATDGTSDVTQPDYGYRPTGSVIIGGPADVTFNPFANGGVIAGGEAVLNTLAYHYDATGGVDVETPDPTETLTNVSYSYNPAGSVIIGGEEDYRYKTNANGGARANGSATINEKDYRYSAIGGVIMGGDNQVTDISYLWSASGQVTIGGEAGLLPSHYSYEADGGVSVTGFPDFGLSYFDLECDQEFRCVLHYPNPHLTCPQVEFYYGDCEIPHTCDEWSGAFLPSITACRQRLILPLPDRR